MYRRELWPLIIVSWGWGRVETTWGRWVGTWRGWRIGRVWWRRISGFSCRGRFSGGGGFGFWCSCSNWDRLSFAMSLSALVMVMVVMFAMLAMLAVFTVRQISELLGCVHLIDAVLGVLAILKAQMVWVDHHLVLP